MENNILEMIEHMENKDADGTYVLGNENEKRKWNWTITSRRK